MTGRVTVQYPPSTSLSPASPSPALLEGGDHNVTCLASANPPAQVVWVRLGTGEEVGHGAMLVLRIVTRQQAGAYSCTATSEPLTVDLRVQYAARVVAVRPGGALRGQLGGQVELECEGEGSPAPALSWQQTSARGVASRGQGSRLSLSDLQYEDQGEYSCLAENSLGQERSPPVSLEVEGPPRVALGGNGGVQILEGGDAVLEVEWCAAPFPRQVWLLTGGGGEELSLAAGTSHGQYRAEVARPAHLSNCYVSALHILGADSLATRQLRLRLENEHGTEEHVAQLVVGAQWRREGVVGGLVGAVTWRPWGWRPRLGRCRYICIEHFKHK